jgi:hypothetical protein
MLLESTSQQALKSQFITTFETRSIIIERMSGSAMALASTNLHFTG